MPTSLRSGGNKLLGDETSRPLIYIHPLEGLSKPAINLKRVVFPHPEGPNQPRSSPLLKVRFKPLRDQPKSGVPE